VFADGLERSAARLLALFMSVWDAPSTRLPLVALVRAGLAADNSSHDE
jgi:hypothetical protein